MSEQFDTNIKIGILGGGQLGRMIYQEAINFGINLHFLDKAGSPCSLISPNFVEGSILDFKDVMAFGADKDVLTIEIENVNVEALYELEKKGVKVYPQPAVIELIQDKGAQKEFYEKINVPTADYVLIENAQGLAQHTDKLPFVQKLRKGGYDGKGVQALKSAEEFKDGFDAPCVLEQFVEMDKELSVIVARRPSGATITFPIVEQEFNDEANLVEFLFTPAGVSSELEEKAAQIATKIVTELDMFGILAVEFFLNKSGELYVNEIAPRPHNSGHQTIEGNLTSQFEQHLRAICDLHFGSTDMIMPSVMINMLGSKNSEGPAQYSGLNKVLDIPGVYPHIYGKSHTKPFRKMGHITVVNKDLNTAKRIAREVKEIVQVIGK